MKANKAGNGRNGGNGGGVVGGAARRKRIMILDDHPLVCAGIAALIEEDDSLEVVAMAHTVEAAFQALRAQVPDLLLLDISLPKTSGLDVLKDLRLQYPALDVLVVSMHDENVYAEHVVKLGAKGYIMKQEASEKIVEAILQVLGGGIYASPAIVSRLLLQLSTTGSRKGGRTGPETLATRELQVYTLIGEGLSTQDIAKRLKISAKTVQTHREHIKVKLGLATAAELSHSAWTWRQSQS